MQELKDGFSLKDNMLQGYKTYMASLIGIFASYAGILFHQLNIDQGVLSIIAFFVIAALRDAMKTERGKLAVQIGEQLAQKIIQGTNSPNPPTIPFNVDKFTEAFKKALTESTTS